MRHVIVPLVIVAALIGLATIPLGAAPALQSSYRDQVGVYLPAVFKNYVTPTRTLTPTVTPTATGTATPTIQPSNTPLPTNTPMKPAKLEVLSSSGFYASSFYYVVGEALNTGDYFAYNARVTARFFDANNTLVAVETGYGLLSRIDPAVRTPFRILLSNAPANIARYELTTAFDATTGLDYRRIAIASRFVRDNFGVEVFGDVRNEQSVPVNNIKVAVTFYDFSGTVIFVDDEYQSLSLTPNTTGAYKVSTFRDVPWMTYLVQSEGYTNQ